MLLKRCFTVLLSLITVHLGFAQESDDKKVKLDPLPNAYGQVIDPTHNAEKGLVVIFTNHNCLYSQLYVHRLNNLYDNYSNKGVRFVAIETKVNSLEKRSSSLERYLEEEPIKFPYLIDLDNTTASLFKVESSPHAYLIKKTDTGFEVLFEGSIDNNSRYVERVTRHYLKDAINQMLAGEEITYKSSKPIGCDIRIN